MRSWYQPIPCTVCAPSVDGARPGDFVSSVVVTGHEDLSSGMSEAVS